MQTDGPGGASVPRDLQQDRPHSARMYDYYLGGKDNYAVDRAAVAKAMAAFPGVLIAARVNRAFMQRATRFLAERGIRQWLDIGTGIPTSPNLHEVAQSVAPDARVVYADNDPIVLAHSRALLNAAPGGATAYIDGNVRDPEAILSSPELERTLDLSRPVVLSLNALMHFVPDEWGPYEIVGRLLAALPSGSALALSHATADFDPEGWAGVAEVYRKGGTPLRTRSRAEVEKFFEGLDLVDPGVEVPHRWRPEDVGPLRARTGDITDTEVSQYAGVAFKP
ncbi:SAM-dependent methyltransferase [Phaeacidiphilus oryzae]|uniref:SAM-dependent methyltransferase n=1 Tax=Phaeacidiphilus oryzae TaxID=348818 RepID=UPI00068CCEBE|nr:SAM-dependent methyltransferase [Phaeacidiphilus oryzae]